MRAVAVSVRQRARCNIGGRLSPSALSTLLLDLMHEPPPNQALPTATEHRDGRSEDVRGPLDLLDVDRQLSATVDGSDLACWASLVCLGCGGVTTDPAHDVQHRRWLAALER
jgi:hypothetical protein